MEATPEASQILQGLTLSQTDGGIVQWTLHAREGHLQEESGEMKLASPAIQLFKNAKVAADIRAEKGFFHEKSGDIHLAGDVVVVSREEQATLHTDALDYVGAESRYRTDRPVLIERPSGRMRGRGLIATRDLSEIHILHQEANLQ